VREFVDVAAQELGFTIEWRGQGAAEHGIDPATGATIVEVDPRYFRSTEVDSLLGEPSKAKRELGWAPTTTFRELVRELVAADRQDTEKEALIQRNGYAVPERHE